VTNVAVPTVGDAHMRTWRDAITPVSRASRRRWTLAYALLLCFGGVYFGTDGQHTGAGWLLVVALFVVFGMLRRGTRRLTAIDHPPLDERDTLARDRAFRLAYPLLLVVLLAVLAILAFAVPDAERTVRLAEDTRAITSGGFLSPDALLGLGVWVALWAIFLPTGVLAWSEPDALVPEPDEPAFGMPEIGRDALLGFALSAGIILGLRQDNAPVGLLPFLGTLMLLGALGRRAAGQPLMQTSTLWRLAAALVLLAGVVAALLVAVGGGAGDG
jgi:hypothetical protein